MIRLVLLFLAMVLGGSVADAAPKAELWAHWQAHDAHALTEVDHGRWNDFLQRYVSVHEDGINRLAYGRVSRQDEALLADYLRNMQGVKVSGLNRNEQRAYWINLYNALTVKVVVDAYPVTSIRKINISPGIFFSGPWGKKLVRIEGEEVSLDDIEHRILRPIWKDPRMHYALNCVSLGCPNLQAVAYTSANSEMLMERGALEYVNHPRGARVDKGKLHVSSIYAWFKDDFGGGDDGVIRHLKSYALPPMKAALQDIKIIDDDDYDWSLNIDPRG